MNTAVFLFISGLSHRSVLLDTAAVFFAGYFAYAWVAVLVLAAFWPHRQRVLSRAAVVVGIVAGLVARYGVKTAIMLVYPRPRPFVVLPNLRPLIAVSPNGYLQSFPSGHTIFFFALATVLFCFNKRIGLLTFLVALLIGIARVYAGVHWPTDILDSAVLGVLTGWLTYTVYRAHEEYFNKKIAQILPPSRFYEG
jgi:undecaprenyl-diphosphatase